MVEREQEREKKSVCLCVCQPGLCYFYWTVSVYSYKFVSNLSNHYYSTFYQLFV